MYKYCKYEQCNVYVKECKYNAIIVSSVSVRPANIIKKKTRNIKKNNNKKVPVLCIYYTQKLTRNTQKAVTLSTLILRQKSELVQLPDAAAVVNMLPPGKSETFKDYTTSVFLNYFIKQAQNIKRIDLIWDQYFENSMKRSTSTSTVSYFAGKGKKTAFQAWKLNPEVTEIFRVLSSPGEQCRVLERFVVVMYSCTYPPKNR